MVDKVMTVRRNKIGDVIGRVDDETVLSVNRSLAVFLGFEAPSFRRDWLLFRGYQWRGDIVSSAEDLAQRDYLSARK
jgi:hypothetical protein